MGDNKGMVKVTWHDPDHYPGPREQQEAVFNSGQYDQASALVELIIDHGVHDGVNIHQKRYGKWRVIIRIPNSNGNLF